MNGTQRLKTLEIGAGDVADYDFDWRVDLRELPHINYVTDARYMPDIPSGSVSIVKSAAMIEHLSTHEQYLLVRECARVLARHGLMFVQTPDRDWIKIAVEREYITPAWGEKLLRGGGSNPHDYHIGLLNAQELERLFALCGFQVVVARDGFYENAGSLNYVMVKE